MQLFPTERLCITYDAKYKPLQRVTCVIYHSDIILPDEMHQ